MSDIISKIEEGKAIELREELMATNYGTDLQEKFKELGVGEIWKAGAKKDLLIQLALQKIEENKANSKTVIEETPKEDVLNEESVVKESNEATLSEEKEEDIQEIQKDDIVSEIEVNEPIIEDGKETEEEEDKAETESIDYAAINLDENHSPDVKTEDAPKYTTQMSDQEYSREDLEKNLENIEANLKLATPFVKAILWEKQAQIIARIEKLDEIKTAD